MMELSKNVALSRLIVANANMNYLWQAGTTLFAVYVCMCVNSYIYIYTRVYRSHHVIHLVEPRALCT